MALYRLPAGILHNTSLSTPVGVVSRKTLIGSVAITGSTAVNPSVVTTTTAHGLMTGDQVTIAGHATNTAINGDWTVTVTGAATFTVPILGIGAGTSGTVVLLKSAIPQPPVHALPVAVEMPAAWTAAGLSFAVMNAAGTYVPLVVGATVGASTAATEHTITTAIAATIIGLHVPYFFGTNALKLQSGTSGAAVAQSNSPGGRLLWVYYSDVIGNLR